MTHAFPQRMATCEPRFLIHELGLILQPSTAVLLLVIYLLTCRSRSTSLSLFFLAIFIVFMDVGGKLVTDINKPTKLIMYLFSKLLRQLNACYDRNTNTVFNQLAVQPIIAPGYLR